MISSYPFCFLTTFIPPLPAEDLSFDQFYKFLEVVMIKTRNQRKQNPFCWSVPMTDVEWKYIVSYAEHVYTKRARNQLDNFHQHAKNLGNPILVANFQKFCKKMIFTPFMGNSDKMKSLRGKYLPGCGLAYHQEKARLRKSQSSTSTRRQHSQGTSGSKRKLQTSSEPGRKKARANAVGDKTNENNGDGEKSENSVENSKNDDSSSGSAGDDSGSGSASGDSSSGSASDESSSDSSSDDDDDNKPLSKLSKKIESV